MFCKSFTSAHLAWFLFQMRKAKDLIDSEFCSIEKVKPTRAFKDQLTLSNVHFQPTNRKRPLKELDETESPVMETSSTVCSLKDRGSRSYALVDSAPSTRQRRPSIADLCPTSRSIDTPEWKHQQASSLSSKAVRIEDFSSIIFPKVRSGSLAETVPIMIPSRQRSISLMEPAKQLTRRRAASGGDQSSRSDTPILNVENEPILIAVLPDPSL
jgi:hypothetical protein